MRVVVAPDKFEGSLRAGEAAAAIEAGLRRARPDAEVVRLPLGDGGAGTLDALLAAGFERVPARVTGPTGEPVEAAIAVDGRRAFVEMAEASGLKRLPGGRRAPLEAMSLGVAVVASRLPSFVEAMGELADYVEADPSAAIDVGLDEALARGCAKAQDAGLAARRRDLASRFTWKANACSTLRVYEQIARQGAQSALVS